MEEEGEAISALELQGKNDVDEEGEGSTSISDTPEGVNGVLESAKCHAPSGRRMAIRMSEPGVCSALRVSGGWGEGKRGGGKEKEKGGKGKRERGKRERKTTHETSEPPPQDLYSPKQKVISSKQYDSHPPEHHDKAHGCPHPRPSSLPAGGA